MNRSDLRNRLTLPGKGDPMALERAIEYLTWVRIVSGQSVTRKITRFASTVGAVTRKAQEK